MPLKKVLILGGTREAAELAAELEQSGKWDVTTSLAGRTKEPAPLAGKVRIGGFGGAKGLAEFIRTNEIEKVIDVTHPFAKTISANAAFACQETGTVLEVRMRAPWGKQDGDRWIDVGSLEEAANALPSGARVFLALGRQYIGAFTKRNDCHFLIRMVDMPETELPFSSYRLIAAKPSSNPNEEAALLSENDITHIVCRNSGGKGAYAKIVAAREMGLPVIMIGR
ncbi:cobalt-precorrin-6A reductase [Rhizobium sp. L1K21]|uniref:cobalt-precorrin-6A reductase n=1 Tax=Rhizobium sp. L1K21 TaxID=2954933 RepID=UPI00209380C6|nr:cobalt-precorrin-6A reductase [Rhizobium sp. L1K21]MCO6185798.1 cobalt-precorrin-6A reductase [Rhizobium sp. L1K21]